MTEIISTDDLARRLEELSPTHVAVAFIGRDWACYLNPKHIECLVVSPGLGTNPAAVVEVAETIGWDRVLLLDELHSKLYLNAHAALIGSANLSRQALEPGGQQELCVMLDDEVSVQLAQEIFAGYARKAEKAFPTKADKLARLHELRRQRRRAEVYKVPVDEIGSVESKLRRFADYDIGRDGEVFLSWTASSTAEYTENVPSEVQRHIADEVHFAPDDLDPEQQWFLRFYIHANDPGLHLGIKPTFVYVHRVFEGGSTDEGYEDLGVQMDHLPLPQPPFDLEDPCFVQAFREVIGRDAFAALRGASSTDPNQFTEDAWRFRDHRELNREFLDELKRVYKEPC